MSLGDFYFDILEISADLKPQYSQQDASFALDQKSQVPAKRSILLVS